MIRLIKGLDLDRYEHLLGQMFEARTRLFSERLEWDVHIDKRGWEIDQYDRCDPLYLISVDDRERHQGSLRLLPTTGETMLRDVFKPVFDDTVIESPLIWECTRFCIESNASSGVTVRGLHKVTTALLLGICEVGLRSGIEHIVGVFDRRMIPIYRRGGWSPEIVGENGSGREAVFLGVWEVNEDNADAIRDAGGFRGSILDPASRKRAGSLLKAA